MTLVSILLTVYNGEKYLSAAIESVLEQTYQPIELIVVNDGSCDASEQIAKRYGSDIRYFYQENRGQIPTQNWALAQAVGDYISFLDADDLFLPDKIALQVEALKLRPKIDGVFGHVEQFFSPELAPSFREKWVCPSGSAPGYLAASGLFRKGCFERIGILNEALHIGGFVEWYMRALDGGCVMELLSEVVLRRRIHENNMGVCSQHLRLEYVQIVRSALQRRLFLAGQKK